jgi:hypothetical protein
MSLHLRERLDKTRVTSPTVVRQGIACVVVHGRQREVQVR